MNKWIDVNENLPLDPKVITNFRQLPVLVRVQREYQLFTSIDVEKLVFNANPNGECYFSRGVNEAVDRKFKTTLDKSDSISERITHWMHLPSTDLGDSDYEYVD